MTAEGIAHGDLSAYNMLWWDERIWFIDFPQAIDIAANSTGLDFLHRDVINVCDWFERRGIDVDAEEVFADIIAADAGRRRATGVGRQMRMTSAAISPAAAAITVGCEFGEALGRQANARALDRTAAWAMPLRDRTGAAMPQTPT